MVQNNCNKVVSVGVLTNGGGGTDQTFDLTPSASNSFSKPDQWGGRVWGRYQCSGDSGKDPNSCGTPGATNPASLAEFFFKGTGGQDYYDISLVDGYNLPLSIEPSGGGPSNGYSCGAPKCDIGACADQFAVKDATGNVVSCMSDCSKTGSSADCCTGENAERGKCQAGQQAQTTKQKCPDAYSYAHDDQSSTFECAATGYTVKFC
ncbi:thaumatin [Mycotypha africana]|uniref:thaumatin n=1 Tax=Mycotypha africana TaxID=64632 RepID=UPI0023017AD3|nr:thaumatin [Mycotypha africana]KAI8992039.1 thaumatin [Mycotypha africana]